MYELSSPPLLSGARAQWSAAALSVVSFPAARAVPSLGLAGSSGTGTRTLALSREDSLDASNKQTSSQAPEDNVKLHPRKSSFQHRVPPLLFVGTSPSWTKGEFHH
uniref:Uncharacterized protein n=1 Tax=Timema bartmani TaxID=61472 RepID=A0A7R9ETP3_9NEOP|nr:unnamed protein product [Timema bartmani]